MKTEDISVSNEKISCFILHGAGLLLALLTSHDLPCHACKAVTCVFSEPILFYFSLPSILFTLMHLTRCFLLSLGRYNNILIIGFRDFLAPHVD